jgi:hypothetical protein
MAVFQSNADAAVPAWTALDIADTTGTTDPNTIANGAVTMSGEFFQIPVSHSVVRTDLNAAYVLHFATPVGLMDGSDTYMAIRVTFGTLPVGAYGVHVGTWDDSATTGLVGGLRKVASTGKTRPRMCTHSNFSEGNDASATALAARGLVHAAGSYDGVDVVLQSGSVVVAEDGTVQGSALANTGSATPTTADMDLAIAITYSNNVLETETLDVKCEYAVIPYPV